MGKLFDQEKPLWRAVNNFADIVLINVIFLIVCLPIITIGPAYTALYYTLMKSVRRGRGYLVKNFFHSFKQNFVQGACAWLVILLFGGSAGLLAYSGWKQTDEGGGSLMIFWLAVFVMIFILCFMVWIFPSLSRFNFTVGKLFAFSGLVAFKYIYLTAGILMMFVGAFFISYFCIPLFILCMPALFVFGQSFLNEVAFKIYMPKFENGNENTTTDSWYYE